MGAGGGTKANLGIQLYTLRELMRENFAKTLEAVSNIGYRGVEFAGYGNYRAHELKKLMDDFGLEAVSSHIPLIALEQELDAVIAFAKEVGISYLVCPFLPEDKRKSLSDYERLARSLSIIGNACESNGITFCYHNHAFEFEVQTAEDQYALDALFDWTKGHHVQAELDLYWIEYAGESAVAYLQKYAGRVPLVHLKDMENGEGRGFKELGQGIFDLSQMVETAKESGSKWLFVEQDECLGDPLESVSSSFAYMQTIL